MAEAHPGRKAIGARIRAMRKERGLSQELLAERAGLDRTYLGGVERGDRNVAVDNLLRIAYALGVSLSDLVDVEH